MLELSHFGKYVPQFLDRVDATCHHVYVWLDFNHRTVAARHRWIQTFIRGFPAYCRGRRACMWWSALLNYLDLYPDNHFPTLLSHNCSLPWWSKLGRGTPSTWHLRFMPSEGIRAHLKRLQEWLPRLVLSLGPVCPDGCVPMVSNLFCELR